MPNQVNPDTTRERKDEDAGYVAFLRASVEAARANPQPSLPSAQAAGFMVQQRELRRVRLSIEVAMV